MAAPLPPCPERFTARKAAILELLDRPDDDYTDASPKGSVDEGVRPLLAVLNALDGFVSTSSCAGRVAVFMEGRKKSGNGGNGGTGGTGGTGDTGEAHETHEASELASAGGKGGGGKWLFVSHDPLVQDDETDWTAVFGLAPGGPEIDAGAGDERLVHFKFEPMILHVLTASLAHAQLLLRCASMAGFRESGAVSIVPPPLPGTTSDAPDANPSMPIVAVRSMGLALASVVGVASGASDEARCIVTPQYLARLVRVANERFAVNRERTERFRANVVAAMAQAQAAAAGLPPQALRKKDGAWEDAEARRARKREEGLRRQAAQKTQTPEPTDPTETGAVLDLA